MARAVGAIVKRKSRTPREVLGRAITELRVQKHVSQATMATALNLSTQYLIKIETGEANVSCEIMDAVATYFRMSIGQLWTYAERLSGKGSRSRV